MIYVASPYTHADPAVMAARAEAAAAYLAHLFRSREFAFSPIVHSHPVAVAHALPRDFGYWQHFNRHMIDRAEAVHVLRLRGWWESQGVHAEVEYASARGVPVAWIARSDALDAQGVVLDA